MKASLFFLLLPLLSSIGAAEVDRAQLALFGKLPAEWPNPANPSTPEKIALGRMLYFEPRLSLSQEISCNSCHGLASFGVDGKPFSDGHAGHKTGRNSPTVLNAAAHLAQFWDGRAADVEAQAKGPILAGGEMAMPNEAYVIQVLKSIPGYQPHFAAAFPGEKDPVTYDNVAKAIGAFERKLSTPSRFDDYLDGKEDALTADEKRGLSKFLSTGCTACHNGPVLGGMLYQKVGLVKPWPFLNDEGRSKISGNPAEKGFFKVPSLRNIAETGPYFHDGSVNSLEVAVALMAEYQLGRQLPTEDVADIAAFLRSLTGRVDAAYVEPPALPESGPSTPAPKHD
ncbi:MAG: cytochrome c peroxidase [Verrucomicrobia bacterium]|jgi:cytochrome c peroxidase|nr:MAG: cytochrome c peroxidase [Verrucomicrobiota bacterium]